MKKLMTVLASAATALFAFGDGDTPTFSPHGTGFEVGYTEQNRVFNPQNDDSNSDAGSKYWFSTAAAGEVGDISNHAESVSFPSVPDMYSTDTDNRQYLHIDASAPLFRSAVANTQSGSFTGVDIDDGIYLDTLVQFTAADDEFQDGSLQDGDKIAISYVEHEDDVTTDENEAWTNFVIRAGYIGTSEITKKNYKAKLPADAVFNKDGWHRLTVRTVPNIDTNGNVGFVVYVDQVALVYADDNETIGTGVELAGVAATVPTSVFPSAVAAGGTGGSTISAASFSGTGAIDDVVITKDMPNFIKENSLVRIAITLGTGVTGVTVTTNSVAVDADATSTEAMKVFLLAPETASFGLTGIYETGYSNLTAVFADGDTTSRFDDGTVTFEGASLAFTVKASRNNFNVFDGKSDAISGTYETLSQALAAEGVAKIQLAYDYVVTSAEISAAENEIYSISGNLVLDLNGKTLNGGNGKGYELFYVTGSLTVIDSSAANTGKIVYGGPSVFGAEGSLYVGAAEGDNGVAIDGVLFTVKAEGYIVNAKVLASANTAENAFAWAEFVAEGSTLQTAPADGYWVVTPGDTPQPTTYTVTVTPTANATYAAVIGETAVTFTENVATVNEGSTVVITATASSGYTYTGVEATGWTIAQDGATATYTISSIAAAAAVVIPAPTPVETPTTFALTTTGGANADVVTDPTDVSALTEETEVTITATPKTDYTYTGVTLSDGWALNSETGAISKTLTVSKDTEVAVPDAVSASGKTYPSYIGDDTAKGKYDTWATYAGISDSEFPDAQGTNKDAYLLNCKPSEVADAKAAFKFTSISYDAEQSKWVTTTTTSYNERTYNGTVTVTGYTDVGCTLGNENEAGPFFKAELK